jgi:pimeloyl-ACP methyl ester carboxylesterase
LVGSTGCQLFPRLGTDPRGGDLGKTFYVGGAGPIGNVVGSTSVPRGLRKGGYRGAIEVFGWQSVVGGTLRDQMDLSRNRNEGRRLAQKIIDYLDEYPGRHVNLIGLSAGTGILTFALEALPEEYRVGQVIFLGSSLSRTYNMATALRRFEGVCWNFYSTQDQVLKYAVPITGSVDRAFQGENIAGLHGLAPPPDATDATVRLYRRHVRNMPWQPEYRSYGWDGGHTGTTNAKFVAAILAQLIDPASGQVRGPSAEARQPGLTLRVDP